MNAVCSMAGLALIPSPSPLGRGEPEERSCPPSPWGEGVRG